MMGSSDTLVHVHTLLLVRRRYDPSLEAGADVAVTSRCEVRAEVFAATWGMDNGLNPCLRYINKLNKYAPDYNS